MSRAGSFKDDDVFLPWYTGYDRSVMYWFLNNVKRGGKSVPAVFATPERAFGQMEKVLRNKFGSSYQGKSVPLPFISMQRMQDTLDHERRWHYGRIRKMQAVNSRGKYSAAAEETPDDADQLDSWLGMEFPHPVTLNYQVEAWARIGRDLDLIRYRILMAFEGHGSAVYLNVEHLPPFGWQKKLLTLSAVRNTSQLEVQEGQDRTLRETYDFTLEAWIPFPAEATKAVKAGAVDVEAVDDLETEDEGTFVDRLWHFDERPEDERGDAVLDRWDERFDDDDARFDP